MVPAQKLDTAINLDANNEKANFMVSHSEEPLKSKSWFLNYIASF